MSRLSVATMWEYYKHQNLCADCIQPDELVVLRELFYAGVLAINYIQNGIAQMPDDEAKTALDMLNQEMLFYTRELESKSYDKSAH